MFHKFWWQFTSESQVHLSSKIALQKLWQSNGREKKTSMSFEVSNALLKSTNFVNGTTFSAYIILVWIENSQKHMSEKTLFSTQSEAMVFLATKLPSLLHWFGEKIRSFSDQIRNNRNIFDAYALTRITWIMCWKSQFEKCWKNKLVNFSPIFFFLHEKHAVTYSDWMGREGMENVTVGLKL